MYLLHQLHRHATDRPDQLAVRECCSGKTLTYRQLAEAVAEFSSRLQIQDISTKTLLIRCGNRIEFYIAFLACLSAQHVVFPVPCDMVELELRAAATRSGASAIIENDLHIKMLPPTSSALTQPALLLQSSGTTGLPKIVCRPTTAMDASARQIMESVGLHDQDHILMCVPVSHSYGLEHGLLAAIVAGAATHLTSGFDVGVIGRELVQSPITILPAVPAVFEMLVRFDDLPAKFPHLRLAYSAGGPLPVSVNNAFQKRFGPRIGQIYGTSEFGSVTFADPRDEPFNPLSVGRAMPGVEMKVDTDSQLVVRTPSQMRGYLGEETSLTPDEFFPSGDLATIDEDGQLTLTGRLKLLIDIAGRKVNPLEVEQALMQHPQVAECIVVSMQQTETLRRLKAFIISRSQHPAPLAEELREFLKDKLSPYKIPRVFENRTSLPRSAAGKILRQALENL